MNSIHSQQISTAMDARALYSAFMEDLEFNWAVIPIYRLFSKFRLPS